jgi:hypothetical protein
MKFYKQNNAIYENFNVADIEESMSLAQGDRHLMDIAPHQHLPVSTQL